MPSRLIVVFLLLWSALFSASELAIMWVPLYKIKRFQRQNPTHRFAKILARLRERPERTLITILVGNNLMNVILSLYAWSLGDGITQWFGLTGPMGFFLISFAITFLILFFGEIIPKVFANRFSLSLALWISPLMLWLEYIIFPIVWLLEKMVQAINRLSKSDAEKVSRDDVEIFVEDGEKQGIFTEVESLIVKNLMDFRETSVDAVFRHRTEIFALSAWCELGEAIEEVLANPHSRIPIYQWDKDNIVGILTLRDILRLAYDEENKTKPLYSFSLNEVAKVPITASIFDMFMQMKKFGWHMAIVVDEYGGTAWLVTFEDILEAILGDIKDEVDTHEEQEIVDIDQDTLIVKGDVTLREVLHHLKLSEFQVPEDFADEIDEESMISYIILHHLKNFAKKGDTVLFGSLELTVTKVNHEGEKIERVKIDNRTENNE